MAPNIEILPEGTDTIITGASAGMADEGSGATPPSDTHFSASKGESGPPAGTTFEPNDSGSGTIKEKLGQTTADLRGQAADKARDLAMQGKEKAIGALDNVVKLVDDAADTIDEKIGEQYGAYARRASESISSFATAIRDKDVDDLMRDAREAVRKSPALAIGAAAAVGFLVARVIKAASQPAGGGSETASSPPKAPEVPDRPAA